jgi:hypothetical protein
VAQHGLNWPLIAFLMLDRNARQCRDRWFHYLAPGLNHEPWTSEEDALLLQKFRELGSKWAKIAKFFPGRTRENCRNRLYALERRKQRIQRSIAAQPQDDFSWDDINFSDPDDPSGFFWN